MDSTYFQNFTTSIAGIKTPKKFTFPFYYEPHLLAKIAVKELQDYLESQTDFTHNFGLDASQTDLPIGKMFGVLVVQNQQNEIGYLAAFSGKLADKSLPKKFVPPVFNMRTEGSFYIKGEIEIDEINENAKQMVKEINSDHPDIDKRLFQDLGDNYQFDQSMRSFYTTASTTNPNAQEEFAKFCYGNMPSCKDGDDLQCVKDNARYINY